MVLNSDCPLLSSQVSDVECVGNFTTIFCAQSRELLTAKPCDEVKQTGNETKSTTRGEGEKETEQATSARFTRIDTS